MVEEAGWRTTPYLIMSWLVSTLMHRSAPDRPLAVTIPHIYIPRHVYTQLLSPLMHRSAPSRHHTSRYGDTAIVPRMPPSAAQGA